MSTTTHSSRMKANFSENCHSKQVADRSIGDYQNYFIEGIMTIMKIDMKYYTAASILEPKYRLILP